MGQVIHYCSKPSRRNLLFPGALLPPSVPAIAWRSDRSETARSYRTDSAPSPSRPRGSSWERGVDVIITNRLPALCRSRQRHRAVELNPLGPEVRLWEVDRLTAVNGVA